MTFSRIYDDESAQDLLGAVLHDPGHLARLAPLLSVEDFHPQRHRPVWAAFLDLEQRGVPINPVTVARSLADRDVLFDVGGLAALESWVETYREAWSPSAAGPLPDLTGPVSKMRSDAVRRRVLGLWGSLFEPLSDPTFSAEDALADLRQRVAAFTLFPPGDPLSPLRSPAAALSLSAVDLAAQSFAGPLWLLDRLFVRGGVNLLAGEITSGKTFLALDLALSVAAGQPAWDQRACAAGAVLYYCQDSGPRTIQRRMLALCAGRGLPPPAGLCFDFSPLNLAVPAGLEVLLAQVRRQRATLVILDALARYLPGVDENNVASVGPIFTAFRTAASQTGASFLIIHHFNKSSGGTAVPGSTPTARMGRFRGSSDIAAAVDAALSVTVPWRAPARFTPAPLRAFDTCTSTQVQVSSGSSGGRRPDAPEGGQLTSRRLITPEKNRELPEQPAFEFCIVPRGADALVLEFTSSSANPVWAEGDVLAWLVATLRSSAERPFTRAELESANPDLAAVHIFAVNRAFAALPGAPGVRAGRRGHAKTYWWGED